MNRLDSLFARLRTRAEAALFPYVMAGYPDCPGSEAMALAALRGEADGLEVGVPFSDPLADGLTLQRANYQALLQGTTPASAFALVQRLRECTDAPLMVMSYFNPVFVRGVESFARDLQVAGGDALIVPDLPVEEAHPLDEACRRHGIYLIHMLAPTSTDERVRKVAQVARGFIYCVSLAGVTGARPSLSLDVPRFISRVRQFAAQPLVIGFGISAPEHMTAIAGLADGAVVASALLDLADRSAPTERNRSVEEFVRLMKAAAIGTRSRD